MNIYLISQSERTGYDTYDSAVVAAKNIEDAKYTHPNDMFVFDKESGKVKYSDGVGGEPFDGTWTTPSNVDIKLIGKAVDGIEAGIICSSFNAG